MSEIKSVILSTSVPVLTKSDIGKRIEMAIEDQPPFLTGVITDVLPNGEAVVDWDEDDAQS